MSTRSTKEQPERPARSSSASAARLVAVLVAVLSGVMLQEAIREDWTSLFAVAVVLFVAALIATRAPSLFWVPRPEADVEPEEETERSLRASGQRARR